MNDAIFSMIAAQLNIPSSLLKRLSDVILHSESWEEAVMSGKVNDLLVSAALESGRSKGIMYSDRKGGLNLVLKEASTACSESMEKTSGPQFYF